MGLQHVEGGTVRIAATVSIVYRVEQLGEIRASTAAVRGAVQEALESVVGIDVGFVVSDYLEPSVSPQDVDARLAGDPQEAEYIVAEGILDEILEVQVIERPTVPGEVKS